MSAPMVASGTASTSASGPPSAGRPRHHHHHRRQRDRHLLALDSIRHFLKDRSSYDVLPVSFRLIVLDTQLVVGPALEVMFGAGVVSAPLWHSIQGDLSGKSPPTPTALSPDPRSPLTEPASAPAAPATATPATPHPRLPAHSMKPGFAGMLTVNDIIHLIQYYYQHSSYETAKKEVDSFRLEGLREIEAKLAVPPPPLLSCHPLRPLFEACQLLMKTHARRLPLLDHDEQTGIETVVSVLTQYRVLKFIAMNCRETASLHRSIRALGIGTFISTYAKGPGSAPGSRRASNQAGEAQQPAVSAPNATPLTPTAELPTPTNEDTPRQELKEEDLDLDVKKADPKANPATTQSPPEITPPPLNSHYPLYTATLDTTVFDVVHMFSEHGISAVPIVDEEGYAVDMYESVDVITLVRTGAYQDLDLTIRQALTRRSADFPGIYSCSPEDSVANIFALLRKRRVHRLLIVEPENEGGGEKSSTTDTDIESPSALEEELEANGPRIRRRGRLVGILALSDLLRHIIGLPPASAAASAAGSVPASGIATPAEFAQGQGQQSQPQPQTHSHPQTHLHSADVIPPSTQTHTQSVIPETEAEGGNREAEQQ